MRDKALIGRAIFILLSIKVCIYFLYHFISRMLPLNPSIFSQGHVPMFVLRDRSPIGPFLKSALQFILPTFRSTINVIARRRRELSFCIADDILSYFLCSPAASDLFELFIFHFIYRDEIIFLFLKSNSRPHYDFFLTTSFLKGAFFKRRSLSPICF